MVSYNRATKWSDIDVTFDVLRASRDALDLHGLPIEDIVALPTPDPAAFTNPESFRDAYWRSEVWSKHPFKIEGVDRAAKAYATATESEERCADSNKRLADLWSRPIPDRYRAILMEARSLLEHLFKGFTLDEVIQHVGWGPGATTSLRRAQATPQNKWVLGAHMTEGCVPYYLAFSQWCNWPLASGTFHNGSFRPGVIVRGNKVTTVPKNAKTDRVIAIEPDWNMFFQLGLGGAMRARLRQRFGILQRNSDEVNKILARKGSEDGFLCTIDLKSASDTVSLALVEALLPENVLSHVMNLRSPVGRVGGREVTYEKVSSMGNGFTFELETALFYSICRAAAGHACVFGDDIVVPSTSYQLVSDILEFCGFEVNTKKSHYTGPFRESCGGHFFSGVDVTPPYFRDPLVGPTRISCANRVSELVDNGYWRRGDFKQVHDALTKGIPRTLYGPKGIDGVVHCNLYESRPEWSKRYQCFKGTRLLEAYKVAKAPPLGAYMQALWGRSGHSQWQKPSGRPVLHLKTWYGHWQGLSPWAS